MTYRELLKLYQEGKLDKAQTDEVEHAIEKQEAISEYLYEKEEIPGLEVLQRQEKEEVFVQGNDAESEEEQRFVKMIQKTIRRTFFENGCDRRNRRACRRALCDLCSAAGCIGFLL